MLRTGARLAMIHYFVLFFTRPVAPFSRDAWEE
jgi:hypothetical protein